MIFCYLSCIGMFPVERQAGMLEVMARKTKTVGKSTRAADTQDVFSRIPQVLSDKFDKIIEGMVPRSSRSAVIWMLIQQFVDEREKSGGSK